MTKIRVGYDQVILTLQTKKKYQEIIFDPNQFILCCLKIKIGIYYSLLEYISIKYRYNIFSLFINWNKNIFCFDFYLNFWLYKNV